MMATLARPPMTRGLRIAHIIVGLVLMIGCSQVWIGLVFRWMFWPRPGVIQQFDLRPYRFASLAAQVWFHRLLEWGWPLLTVAGMVILVIGIRNRPAGPHRGWWLGGWALLGLALFGATQLSDSQSPSGIPIASLSGLQTMMHMDFPPGTQLLNAGWDAGIDSWSWAKVTMPTEAVLPFVKGSFLRSAKNADSGAAKLESSWLDPPQRFVLNPDIEDWHPEMAKRPLTALAWAGGGRSARLIADLSDGKLATVYLVR